ncbi:F-box domain-containing protein [Colletotrichum graminicola]|uniref:F-box domain-containing protein n=1 Tax=Colletotrichum graminicola (strain M1.001 / M2 / FGSC 10212) TaxID=645133 RepID=E3Q641_COLGM|nr:F-box domain-containing protein [Colletotrichum graminicola M1.001]EFQ26289.1 F-box domain-containing protein [Colletotrichum graminicola M1.001]WDK14097.1 F-box domain-containing protein [Colletotrichum graminicola]
MHNATGTVTSTGTHQQDEGKPRSSTDKTPILTPDPAFDRLPDEIIQQILQLTDPDSFASLILLNSKWRSVSQQAQLYALHLSRCQSYSASHPPLHEADVKDEDLPRLRRLFAKEVKRNLFEAYLRPRETVIKLISNSISSSSCPGGEGMQFSPSPRGHHVLAYNSSRVYVLDVRGKDIDVKREFKILRRPVSTCIKDDGSMLAVLSSEMQVDLYDLEQSPPRRTQSLILDNPPRTIALSPCGSVLAAAYEGGIEVSLVNPGALPTDRRAVKCDGVDALSFSFDGTQILGTTVHSSPPATVILTAPYYDPGNQMADDSISALWTTSILFPNTSRDCSHAVLLQDSGQEEASWTFTYDRSFETFRAVRIDDLRNGTTYFTGPKPDPGSQAKLTPCTLPTATFHGDLVSAGFQGKDIWLYGVPEDLDAVPEVNAAGLDGLSVLSGHGRRSSGPPSRSPSSRAQENPRVPQWQVLCDKLRNTFVWGAKIAELDGVSTVKWVAGFGATSTQERLVVAARGISPGKSIVEEDDIDFIDGGRIILLDFDYSLDDGQRTEIEIEVGTKEPEILEEEQRDIDAEVAIVRRRTVAQRRGDRGALMRAATTAAIRGNPLPPMPSMPPMPQSREEPEARIEDDDDDDDDPLVPRRIGAPPQINVQEPISSLTPQAGETASMIEDEEAEEAVEAPYSHDGPRSTNTLRRAATAVAINRSRNPQAPAAGPVEYRRADGRREHPHESDADNWVPPPPPYQKDDPGDLPAFLRNAIITPGGVRIQSQPTRIQTAAPAVGVSTWPLPERPAPAQTTDRPLSYHEPVASPSANATHHLRIASDTTLLSRPRTAESASPMFSPPADVDANDDIYDVSPPETPCVAATRPSDADAISPEGQRTAGESLAVQASNNDALQDSQAVAAKDSSVALAALQAQSPPSLGLQIPSSTSPNAVASGQPQPESAADVPLVRRLSNAQTWPRSALPLDGPHLHPESVALSSFPYSAPPTNAGADEIMGAALPAPFRAKQPVLPQGSEQLSPYRPWSGNFSSVQRVPVGSRRPGSRRATVPQPAMQPGSQAEVPDGLSLEDQPLIISTPSGVTGAYDAPTRQQSNRRSEMPLLAPIPRHPRPTQPGPHVERLETIYSDNTDAEASGSRSLIPAWLQAPPTPSAGRQSHSSVNRRPSRAERSAAKNIKDAKRRGWNGTKKKSKSKKVDHEVASSAGWTDVSAAGGNGIHGKSEKDKKCVVM